MTTRKCEHGVEGCVMPGDHLESECHTAEMIEAQDEVRYKRLDHPWPLADIMRELVRAARHLHHEHDCDHQGWENTKQAIEAANEWLKENS